MAAATSIRTTSQYIEPEIKLGHVPERHGTTEILPANRRSSLVPSGPSAWMLTLRANFLVYRAARPVLAGTASPTTNQKGTGRKAWRVIFNT